MAQFMGQELKGPCKVEVDGVGEGSVNGSTRKKLVDQRGKSRGSVLDMAHEKFLDQQARPLMVWPQMDKLSSAWLLSYPGPHTGMPAMVFSEAVCGHLCLPSPACRDRVVEKVGKAALQGDRRIKQ